MRTRVPWAALALVVVIAAAVGWVALSRTSGGTGGSSPTDVARSSCPDEMPTGSQGVTVPGGSGDAEPGHLVPEGSPVAVTVCRYAPDEPSGSGALPLSGSTELAGDLDRVVAELRAVPLRTTEGQVSCMLRSARTPYLLVVDYGETSAWVAAEYTPECDYASRYTTNGAETFERIGKEIHESHARGRWPR